MSYRKITELIQKWEEYEHLSPEATMKGFGQWLSVQDEKKNIPIPVNTLKRTEKFKTGWLTLEGALKEHHKDKQLEVQIGMLIGRLGRYGRLYTKKALQPLDLNLEEFTLLASIFHLKNPRKSDAFTMNLLEPTSGTEIVRRLIKLNYVKESASKEDKRSKLLKLTPIGEKTLFKAFELMTNVGVLTSANLTNQQKKELISMLDYMNDFHASLYLTHKETGLQELIKKYVGNNNKE